MKYKGKDLDTYTKIIDYALSLPADEQEIFVKAYASTGPYALQNVGYFSGYYGSDMMAKIQEIFKTAHPIFGRTSPTPEEAINIGKAMAKGSPSG
jgi:hypothetical protein